MDKCLAKYMEEIFGIQAIKRQMSSKTSKTHTYVYLQFNHHSNSHFVPKLFLPVTHPSHIHSKTDINVTPSTPSHHFAFSSILHPENNWNRQLD